jgi:hypothetical protein
MKNYPNQKADTQKAQETIKIGKTVFIVNHIFTPKQTKQETWFNIITRAEGLKAAKI